MDFHCVVVGCINSERDTRDGSIVSFRFPKDPVFYHRWLLAAGRPDLKTKIEKLHKSYRMCNIHFEPKMLLHQNLIADAIPTLKLPVNLDVSSETTPTQTEIEDSPNSLLPSTSGSDSINTSTDFQSNSSKRKLSETSLSPREIESNKLIKTENDKNNQETESEFIIAQKRVEFIHSRLNTSLVGTMLDNNYTKFIMHLYFASPLAYRFLYKTLNLPEEKKIRDIYFNIDTKLSESMIKCLDYKCKRLSKSEKVCVMSVSTMALKPSIRGNPHRQGFHEVNGLRNPKIGFHEVNGVQSINVAHHAVVLVARGLFSKWKQPIAYCFQKPMINYPEVATWVTQIVNQVLDIGYDVVALTTDNDSIHFNLSKHGSILQGTNSFNSSNFKTFILFDVPQTLIFVRELLRKNDFYYRDGKEDLVASWHDITKIYELEKNKSCRIAQNLTKLHVQPQAFEKVTPRYAAQVFSRSVAVAIEYNVGPGKLPDKALGTAIFARRLNEVFEILNSSPKKSWGTSRNNKKFSGDRYELNTLHEFVVLLNHLRLFNNANEKQSIVTPRCIYDFKKTINTIVNLSVYLKTRGFHHFYAQRLSMDVLKDFLNTLGEYRGHYRQPTSVDFYGKFKKLFLNAAIDFHKIDIANEMNVLFSAIDDVYKEVVIKNELLDFESNQIDKVEGEHRDLLNIKSEEDIMSNQSEESEEEKNEKQQIETITIQDDDEEFEFSENMNKEMEDIEQTSDINQELDEENEFQALKDEINHILKGQQGETSTDETDDAIAYSIFKVEED